MEITCEACSDLFLDTSGAKPVYRQRLPQLTMGADKYVSDEEYAAAAFTFMDLAHGPCFGFTRVGHRAGGRGSCMQGLLLPLGHVRLLGGSGGCVLE